MALPGKWETTWSLPGSRGVAETTSGYYIGPMKLLCTCLFTILVKLTAAQFAIISDKDGYSNVRDSSATSSRVAEKLANGYLVYCFEKKGNWTYINYNKNRQERTGYVYTDRLKIVSDYTIIPQTVKKEDSIVFKKDSITVSITRQKFDKSKYRFTYFKDNPSYIQYINNQPYWGRDGEMPTSNYKAVSIRIGTKIVYLPRMALAGLFEPSLYNTQVHYDEKNELLYIQSSNSDGAGAYELIWKLHKGVYKDRYIAYGF